MGCPGSSAKPRPRLHDQAINLCVGEPPARGDSGRAAADDHHFGISPGHTFIPATVEGPGAERDMGSEGVALTGNAPQRTSWNNRSLVRVLKTKTEEIARADLASIPA